MSVFTAGKKLKNLGALGLCMAGATVLVGSATAAAAEPAATPHYVTIVRKIDVNKPAAAVWSKVGNYCDLSKWLSLSCDIVSGSGNEIGATRKVDHKIIEVLVGKTATSYTYSQPEMPGADVHFYHGTLDVQPVTAKTSRIVYTLFYDNSGIGDAAAQKKEVDGRTAAFQKAVENMKSLAEGTAKP